jgi:uncharacterized protein YhdP
MKKALKLLAFLALTFVLFLVVASLAFYHLIRIGEFRRFLMSEIEQRTELHVEFGEAELELGWITGVSFRDVALSEPGGAKPAIAAQRVTARVELLPLLRRQITFYEIRLQSPEAQIVRDKAGNLPLVDRLLNLPFFKNKNNEFTLDLRTLKITGGQVDFLDHANDRGPATTRLRSVDLALERLRGEALREFFRRFVPARSDRPRGAALKFDLSAGVERDGQHARLRAQGTMVFPEEQLEFARAWWNADAQVTEMPAPMMQSYAGNRLAVKFLSGTLNSRFHAEGNARQRLQVKGEISFKQLAMDAPEIFSAPLAPGDGQVDLDVSWQPHQWELARVEVRSKELQLALRGAVSAADGNDPHFKLSLTAPSLPVAVIKKYAPAKWSAAPQYNGFAAVLQDGELRLNQAGIDARLSEISNWAKTGWAELIWFDGELRNVGADLPGRYLPLRGVHGFITLEKGLLSFKALKGDYGRSRLANVDGSYRFAASGDGALHMRARGEMDLAELREQLQQDFLPPQVAKAAAAVEEMGGKGRFDIAVSRATAGAPQVEGKVALDGARLKVADFSLSEISGDVALTPAEIKAEKVRALLSGSPIQIQLALRDYGAANGTFDLAVDSTGVRAGVVAQLLLSNGSLQDPGMIRGRVRYQGSFGSSAGRKFTGTLDLANVQLSVDPLRQPLKELTGRIHIDEAGIDAQNLKGLLVGFPASFNGRWRYAQTPPLLFDFAAPNLDVGYLLAQIDPKSSAFYANLQASGKIALAKGRFKGLEFSDLTTDVVIDRRVWRLNSVVMRSSGGSLQGAASIADKPDTLGFSVESKVHAVPVQSVLDWLEAGKAEMTGKVNLTGKLESAGKDGAERKRNLNGSFNLRIEDGTIGRLRVMVQILNLLDLSRWFTFQIPDLSKQGIRFRSITGDFKVVNGVYTTQNLLVDSDDLRMTGQGKIDVPNDDVDFLVAVRPFAGIDTAINYIPLIGRGIAAIKNSFLVASFNIKGPIDEPTITPAPLGTLSEVFFGVLGIPKNIIGFGGEDKKEEPQRDQPKAPSKAKAPAPVK